MHVHTILYSAMPDAVARMVLKRPESPMISASISYILRTLLSEYDFRTS